MHPLVVTKDPAAVEAEVQSAYLAIFPQASELFVPQAFRWAIDCFTGRRPGYQAIDAKYHDFEHTLQGTLCMTRLLLGRHHAGVEPRLPRKMFELGLLAILLHDTGYLKKLGDNEGTGAKYTVVHVGRSADFASEFLLEQGFDSEEIKSVRNMIHCTGVGADVSKLPFHDELERMVGCALGTADLLGQMAAEDYVGKLPILYSEFAEAARFEQANKSAFIAIFTSAADLIQKTPGFWQNYVVPKLDRDFAGVFRFLNHPYPDGPNLYIQQIEANIQRVRNELGQGAVAAAK